MLYQKIKRAYEMLQRRCAIDPRLPAGDTELDYDDVKYVAAIVMFWLLDIQYDMPMRDPIYGSWLKTYRERIDPYPILEEARGGRMKLRRLMDLLYFQLVGETPKSVYCFGEKTPSNTLCSRWILSTHPEAKAIVITRNPYKNIASIYNRSFPLHDLDYAITVFNDFYKHIVALKGDERVFFVRYEDVIHDRVATGDAIFAFLGLPGHALEERFTPILRGEYTGSVVTTEKDRKLGEVFSATQTATIRERCRPILERFYPELA